MPRKVRVEYAGAIYHVINRGDRREDIFLGDEDRKLFVQTLGEVCAKTGWQIHAHCLMSNHFHLAVETPRANLVAGMRWFLGTYSARFNRRHKYFGHLFSGRYKSLLVDGSGTGHLRTVCDYVHLNPVRAKLLDPAAPLQAYPWSSWPDYLKPASRRPVWLRVDRVMGENGLARDDLAARRRLESEMERRRELEQRKENPEWKRLRRGWCWGAEEFREEMLGRLEEKRGAHHDGEELKESDQQKAERMTLEMLSKAGWNEAELKRRRKGDAEKARMARRLRHETTMTWRWIAERLKMGHWRAAANAARLTADGEL